MKRKGAIPRIYPATIDGTPDGDPVLKTREQIAEKRRLLGPYTFSTQQLLNPLADEVQGFKKEWIRYYQSSDGSGMNIYLIVDPASEKKKTSDYTAMFVIGLGEDQNFYVLDIVRDRLNLKERADTVFYLVKKWNPLGIGYEKYGMQADIEYIKERQERENFRFHIIELGGHISKNDRIKGLIPSLSEGRWYYPQSMFKTDYEGKVRDLVDSYINEEYLAFPVPIHDDMLDCQSRIFDPNMNIIFPRMAQNERYYSNFKRKRASAWTG
jgi:phage terminase large subunit-like protein